MKHEKPLENPYRKTEYEDDPDEAAIKKMEEEIATEKKFSIQLPYVYKNKNDSYIYLSIAVEKNEAILRQLETKEDSARKRGKEEIRDWQITTDLLNHYAEKIKNVFNTGVNPELEKHYLTELWRLKNSLENLLHTINNELEKKK